MEAGREGLPRAQKCGAGGTDGAGAWEQPHGQQPGLGLGSGHPHRNSHSKYVTRSVL